MSACAHCRKRPLARAWRDKRPAALLETTARSPVEVPIDGIYPKIHWKRLSFDHHGTWSTLGVRAAMASVCLDRYLLTTRVCTDTARGGAHSD